MKNKGLLLCLVPLLMIFTTTLAHAASLEPMLKKYVAWNYGDTADRLSGFIPALNENVVRQWELDRWTATFTFEDDNKTRQIDNYDVFNVKRNPEDQKFDKENGFGLTYMSRGALGDLFDSIMGGRTISDKQRKYYRDNFTASADDGSFKQGNPSYYVLENKFEFLRTANILERMGLKFEKSLNTGDGNRRAIYTVSRWPSLQVTQGKKLSVKFSSFGYTERDIRVIATKRGVFPNLTQVVSLTGGKLIHTSDTAYQQTIQVDPKQLASVLGRDVDIIIDDGYGRTDIKRVTLPDEGKMDFVPTKLTLTEGGQLWVKVRYDGEDFTTSDYVNERGMPMNVEVKIGGAATAEFSMPTMFKEFPTTIKDQQTFNVLLGKIEISESPGKYYIKANATINNPMHQDRALESPADAYMNNEINGQWLIERKNPETDLIAQSVTANPSQIKTGDKTTISAKVKNVGTVDQTSVLVRFYDNNKVIYEVRKNLPSNQVTTVGPFNWTGDSVGVHNIAVHVDPEKEKPDSNRSNNIATAGCRVFSPSEGGNVGECNKPSAHGNWTVTYKLITGYHTNTRTVTWTDANGKSHSSTETYTDYNDPIWESRNVTYNEDLIIEAKLDTKQGIATAAGRQKEADRESRGSWEIIPYAQQNGKDPSTITRAGYGFEIKVKTDYSTDWETKVPVGLEGTAHKIGGTYYGPSAVYATIYDSTGKYVDKIALEKTSGDRNNATWELPEKQVKTESGQVYKERKFFTSVTAPNGYYTIKISSGPAGMTGLTTCITKKVEIYGSMYDDMQNLKVK